MTASLRRPRGFLAREDAINGLRRGEPLPHARSPSFRRRRPPQIRLDGRAGGGADPRKLVSRPRRVGDGGVWRQRAREGGRRPPKQWRRQALRVEAKKAARANGHHAPREAAAKHDQALLALMRANPGASVTELIRMNGRPRNSTVLSLDRLEKAGLVKHARRGKWTVRVGSGGDLLEVPAPKPAGWIEPLSANHKARHAADGRVRDELTMAAGAH